MTSTTPTQTDELDGDCSSRRAPRGATVVLVQREPWFACLDPLDRERLVRASRRMGLGCGLPVGVGLRLNVTAAAPPASVATAD